MSLEYSYTCSARDRNRIPYHQTVQRNKAHYHVPCLSLRPAPAPLRTLPSTTPFPPPPRPRGGFYQPGAKTHTAAQTTVSTLGVRLKEVEEATHCACIPEMHGIRVLDSRLLVRVVDRVPVRTIERAAQRPRLRYEWPSNCAEPAMGREGTHRKRCAVYLEHCPCRAEGKLKLVLRILWRALARVRVRSRYCEQRVGQ